MASDHNHPTPEGPDGADGRGRDPFAVAQAWLAEATDSEINDPDAMALATVDASGLPNVRMVLLKEIEPCGALAAAFGDPRGAFVFYTNYESAKGEELAATGKAALVLHWKSLRRQVRARGRVERVEPEKADAYFASRGLQSRIGAVASRQSRPLSSRAALMADAALVAARHPLGPPRPEHWGGFRIIPEEIEFWRDGAHRLHDRWRWRWEGAPESAAWRVERLNP